MPRPLKGTYPSKFTEQLKIRFSPEDLRLVSQAAHDNGTSRTKYIRQAAINRALEDQEID